MSDRRPAAFRARWAALIAIGGGLLGVLAFPRFGLWPLAPISVAALSIAVDGRRARTGAWLGLLYGLAFFIPLLSWTGIYVGPAPWVILAVAMAVWVALLGGLLTLVARLPAMPVWVGAAWVLQEALRDRVPFGGFPWGRLAFSQAGSPLRWFAAVGGAPLVTFVVAVAGAGLAILARAAIAYLPGAAGGRVRPVRTAVGGLVTVALVPLLGLLLSWPLAPSADGAGRTQTIAVIQGGLPDRGLAFEDRAQQVLDNHVTQTLKLAAQIRAGTVARPSLVLWPENSSDIDPFADAIARAKIERAVHAVGVPVLVGTILQGPGPDHRRNVGILWSPTSGPGERYTKRHPVPFAEYIPLRGISEWVSSDAKTVTQDMVAGHGTGLLRGGPVAIGDVICFEVAYDELVRSSVAAGAQLIVVQTNNATFGHTAETYQQLAMAQLRAVENGRTVVQVATTGKSAVIGPDGRIRASSGPLFAPSIMVQRVPVRSAQTLATRLGAWPEYALAAIAVLAGAVAVLRSRRSRPRPSDQPGAQHETPQEMVGT